MKKYPKLNILILNAEKYFQTFEIKKVLLKLRCSSRESINKNFTAKK